MTMSVNEKRMMEREALRSVIQQWNANRLDLFECSEPDENLQFHGVMRFYFQDAGQKVATKCIRVASDATVSDVIETLIEKFRPDMRMLSVPMYTLYEVHSNGEERKLGMDEKPLLVQLNWHVDDREGRFLLRDLNQPNNLASLDNNSGDVSFKRKLSKREKKEQKKKEKQAKLQGQDAENQVAEKLYTELPETSFTRSISNPEAVMRRRRQQKFEKKLQQFCARDGGPDTGGTLKIYGESLCRDVPYKTLLLSIRDCAQAVVREMLSKYGLEKADPLHYCLVQVNGDGSEYILDDDECPLSILMNHPSARGSIMFHVRRRPADSQPRRRKKKPLGVSNGSNNMSVEREGPMLVELTHNGDGGRRIKLGSEPIEVGSANTTALQLFGPSIQPRHCLISLLDGVCTVTPLHTDAFTYVNGHHIQQPTVLHNGSVVMFGRVASFRFIDTPADGRYNLALSQSQLDAACLYERSPTSPSWQDEDRTSQPGHSSMAQGQTLKQSYLDNDETRSLDQQKSPAHKLMGYDMQNTTDSMTNQFNETGKNPYHDESKLRGETDDGHQQTFEHEGTVETETKSVSSIKSGGSNQDARSNKAQPEQGHEPILPAVLEFPETYQEPFLTHVIRELDVNTPNFKLAPVYTLYLCARYRASTHYRPELQPTERAHKLTIFLHHVSNLILNVIQEQYQDPKWCSFWMANSSEFLHFLKSDRHISAFSVQAQQVLAECVQQAFRNLVDSFRHDLTQTLNQFLSENIDHDSAAGLVLTVLGSAMALLRRCRVNAALTIQLFSQLFYYIGVVCFNTIITNSSMCTANWGITLRERLNLLWQWADKQGLELAAECHLSKINQCASFLLSPKNYEQEITQLMRACPRLNSLQVTALLSQEQIPRQLKDLAIRMAEEADAMIRSDGREVRLEEPSELALALILPDDGYSCDVVRGIPVGLVDFLTPLQNMGMCRLAAPPNSIGLWTVYMRQYNVNGRSPSAMSSKMPQPEIQVVKLTKDKDNNIGVSIVAAKATGQERLSIFIKSIVPGGSADKDGRLQAGDQLLRVDEHYLSGMTQERAADYLKRTGPVVTLEVAKQGAIYHGLATLIQQPSPDISRGNRRASDRFTADGKPPLPTSTQQLPNSKSVPALHHVGGGNIGMSGNKSRSIHNLTNNNANDQGFYQNLMVYRNQNQSQPNLGEKSQYPVNPNTMMNSPTASTNNQSMNRPASAYFNSTNNTNTLPSSGNMSYMMQPLNSTGAMNGNAISMQSLNNSNSSTAARSIKNFQRESQGQQSLRMNAMMAPSMPNIAHSTGYANNISTSQSMQNVNTNQNYVQQLGGIGPYNMMQQQQQQQSPQHPHQSLQQPQQSSSYMYSTDIQQQQQQQNPNNSLLRGQAKLIELNELVKRRQRDQALNGMQPLGLNTTDSAMGLNQTMSPNANHGAQNSMLQSPGALHHQTNMAIVGKPLVGVQQQSQLPIGIGYNHPQGKPPIKQLPPTAPKPQRPPIQYTEEIPILPPLPPTSTHPLYKPHTVQQNSYQMPMNQKAFASASNPWEREEREKEQEIKREHLRNWRDQQIVDLSNLVVRNQQQEDQLKTLLLERDFERRALEEIDREDENDSNFQKDVREVIRLNQPQNITSPPLQMKQIDVKTNMETIMTSPTASMSELNGTANINDYYPTYQLQHSSAAPTMQPKSILKQSTARAENSTTVSGVSGQNTSPSKQKSASFADEQQILNSNNNSTSIIPQITKELSNVTLNDYETTANGPAGDHNYPVMRNENPYDTQMAMPPPPPERNSSYVVMSQKQQMSTRTSLSGQFKSTLLQDQNNSNYVPNTTISANTGNVLNKPRLLGTTNNNVAPKPQNATSAASNASPYFSGSYQPTLGRDSKRVSFHDEDNNVVVNSQQEKISSSIIEEHNESHEYQEDPNKFIRETTALLQSPTTPESESWNTSVQATPGVIGAQEVYRDPRTKRLAQQQQQKDQKSSDSVPEKLSFKEKMKMFALESGENQTPKDKLKISRAQRDIDAVH